MDARDAGVTILFSRTARETCGAMKKECMQVVDEPRGNVEEKNRSFDDKLKVESRWFLCVCCLFGSPSEYGQGELESIHSSHLKVVDIRRWSIPNEGCYAVRNVIIIRICFLVSAV